MSSTSDSITSSVSERVNQWISEVGLELLGQLKRHFVFQREFDKFCKVLCCLSLIFILSHLSWINLSHNIGDYMNIKERKGNTFDKLARSSQNQYLSKSTKITTNTETAMLSTTLSTKFVKFTLIHKMPVFYEVFWSQNHKIHLIWQETTTSTSRVPIAAWTQFRWFFWWHDVSFFKRKAPLGEYSWRLCPCSPWKEAHSCRHRFSGNSFSRRIMLLDPKPGRENRPERMHEWVPNQWPARYEEFNWLENFKNICCNICYPIKSAF